MAVSLISLNTLFSNSFNSWSMQQKDKGGYTFRDWPEKPKWLTLVKSGRGFKILEPFPKLTQEMANVLDRADIQSFRASGTTEATLKRKFLVTALPAIIEKLENAGFDDHPAVNELRNALFFGQMWLEDKPDTVWTKTEGGYHIFSNSGVSVEEYQ